MTITLVVEDGTGTNAAANTYITSADTDTYWANRVNTAWAALQPDNKAAALIQATQYLDARYNFKGCRLVDGQPLAWPRQEDVINQSVIGYITEIYASPDPAWIYVWPTTRLLNATCELALRASAGLLYTDEQSTIITSEKVDVIQVNYSPLLRNGGQVRFAIVDDLLRPLLSSGGNSFAITRS